MNCCTYECNEGRNCPVRSSRLEQKEGGKTVDTEPEKSYSLGLWLVYGVCLAIFLSFIVMTWVVYPNFPQ